VTLDSWWDAVQLRNCPCPYGSRDANLLPSVHQPSGRRRPPSHLAPGRDISFTVSRMGNDPAKVTDMTKYLRSPERPVRIQYARQAVQPVAISPNSAAHAGKVSGHYAFRKTPEFRRPFKGDVQWRHLRVRILRPQPRSPSLRAQLAFQGYMHIPAARLPQLNKKREAEEGGGSEAFRPALIAEP
jgi:hypothetical protein